MGDALSMSICNERGLRALLECLRNPALTGGVSAGDASRSEEPKSPSSRWHPALSPTFVRRGSDPFVLPPFAPRAESIAHPCAKPSVSTPKRPSRSSTPAHLSMSRTPSLECAPQGFCVPKTAVRVPQPSRDVVCRSRSMRKEKMRDQCDFFNPQHARPQRPVFHSTPLKQGLCAAS